ncbi:MAG TPA: hypothetical protein VEA35_00595 [Ramlibacter sp.]|nr:hypothetical protein [Ramlibacter sp.]
MSDLAIVAGIIGLGTGFYICWKADFEIGQVLFGLSFLVASCKGAGI